MQYNSSTNFLSRQLSQSNSLKYHKRRSRCSLFNLQITVHDRNAALVRFVSRFFARELPRAHFSSLFRADLDGLFISVISMQINCEALITLRANLSVFRRQNLTKTSFSNCFHASDKKYRNSMRLFFFLFVTKLWLNHSSLKTFVRLTRDEENFFLSCLVECGTLINLRSPEYYSYWYSVTLSVKRCWVFKRILFIIEICLFKNATTQNHTTWS